MRQDSNAYIIGFATVVCLVCSIVVSTAAVALRDRQARNRKDLFVIGPTLPGFKFAPPDPG